jgi:glycosyltransferase involved in cell wall biosynthesis
MRKILFFFPHNPYPPKTGAHKRCLELLYGLKELDLNITFASSIYNSDQVWTFAGIEALKKETGCSAVELYYPSNLEVILAKTHNLANRFFPKAKRRLQSVNTLSMKSWFTHIAQSYCPEILFMNYAFFDGMIDRGAFSYHKTIMEMHDLITLNQKMQTAVLNRTGFKHLATGQIPKEVLDIKFFQGKEFSADKEEFEIYNKYNYTLCISKTESDIVSTYSQKTNAIFLPMTHTVRHLNNTYSADALFCIGPNIFNLQGYYYFINDVLPLIQQRQLDFQLTVTGKIFRNAPLKTPERIAFKGFVDNLQYLYENSRFFICPVFGGTGQQVKIIEAMAHGLPTIALYAPSLNSPIKHNINGLIAKDAQDFADCIVTLWNDKKLCRRLGENARDTIANEYSRNRLYDDLSYVIGV